MPKADITPALSLLAKVDAQMRKTPKLMQTAGDREIRRVRPLILKDAALSKKQAPLPFIWSPNSDAQMRAMRFYFANKVPKGSTGGRYSRTGAMDKATKVTGSFKTTEGTVTLENKAKGSEWVIGERQVPSHTRAGHPTLLKVAEKWAPLLTKRYEEIWFTVADPFAGVPQK